jgi:hypothetical protein
MFRTCLVLCCAVLCLAGCDPSSADGDTGPDALDSGLDAGAIDTGSSDAARGDTSEDAMLAHDATSDAGRSRIDEVVALLSAVPPDVAAIEAILNDVAWNEGWPLHEGARFLFATSFDDTPASLTLTGAFDGWSTTAHPALRSATGTHFWIVLDDAELAVPAAGAQYKWIGPGDDYRAPPEATAYGFDSFGRFGYVLPDPGIAHFEQFPDHVGGHLEAPRTFRAYLPAGFIPRSAEATAMRALLVHDGQNVFGPEGPFGGWHLETTLSDPAFVDVVALAIDNAPDRLDAYTHVADVIGGSPTGGRADDYLALIEDEALPFFRGRYGVIATGDSLAIMGSSLGGLVTLYAAATHGSLFGCGAALSPTLGWGSFAVGASDSLITRWPSTVGHGATSLYLDSGGGGACEDSDGDGIEDDGTDSDNYCVTGQMRDVLSAQGYAFDVDLSHWWEPGASHDEAAWAARTDRVLRACTTLGWRAP